MIIYSKPISILFVIDGLEFGGGERTFLQLIEKLPRHCYKIYVATTPEGDFFKKLIGSDIELFPLAFRHRINPGVLKRLARLIEEKKINIIHSQGGRVDFYCRLATRLIRTKVRLINTIAMPVEGYDISLSRKAIYRLFDRFTERYADRFIVVSDILRQTLINNHKIPSYKVIKIYNGIELNEYNPANSSDSSRHIREQYGINADEILVGAIGRMVWQKGFEYLIKGAKDIINFNQKFKILMVGDGPLKGNLQELAKNIGIDDRVIFTGFRKDIKNVLSSIDIVIVPSILEGFPMVTLEAMAMAKPIVATFIDGIKEQISDGIEGILVPPKNTSALVMAIKRVIEDRELAYSLGLTAREKVKKEFQVEKMISETEKVYQTLLS